MSQAHTLRYVRITNSGKLSDRYVAAQVKEASDPDVRVYGKIFAIVEIESPWFPNSQIGQTVINTAAREYFKSTETEPLIRFEAALKKTNETLDQLAKTGEREWIEHLHAVLALVRDDEIHIATTGKARGWLIRAGKSSPMFEPATPTASPAKTFGSVLSGELEAGDRLIFASSGILSLATPTELKTNVFSASDLGASAIRLANLLKAKRGQWVNALVLEYEATATLANRPTTPIPETLYLDSNAVGDWRITAAQVLQRSREGFLQVGSRLNRLNTKLDTFFRETVLPKGKAAVSGAQAWSKQTLSDVQTKAIPAAKQHAQSMQSQLGRITERQPAADAAPSKAQTTPAVTAPGENLIGKSVFAINDYTSVRTSASGPEPVFDDEPLPTDEIDDRVHHYHTPQRDPEPMPVEAAPLPVPSPAARRFPKVTLPTLKLPTSFQELRNDKKSLGFVVLAGILVILLGWNLWALSSKRSERLSRTAAAQKLTELQDQLEEAKLAKIFNQPDKAIGAAQTVVAGTDELATSPLAEDAKELKSDAQTVLDELTSTTRLAPQTLLDIDGSGLIAWGDTLTLSTDDGLKSIHKDGGEVATATIPTTGQTVALTAFDEKEGYAVLTDEPNMYQANQASGPLEAITPAAGDWKASVAIAPFFNSLYTLSPAENQIWRFTATEGNYSAAENYIQDGTSVEGGVDLAIDGSVYVLTRGGEVMKFTRGKRVEFRVRDIPKPNDTLSDPVQIEVANESVYVLASNRIVKFAADGRFEAQYAFADTTAIRSFAIRDNTLYALTDSKLIKAGL